MKRANMTMDELAQAMGYARASSIQRYLTDGEYRKAFISPDLAHKLEQAMLGKGQPPIMKAEIWDMTGMTEGQLPQMRTPMTPPAAETSAAHSHRYRPRTVGALPEIDLTHTSETEIAALIAADDALSFDQVVAEWHFPESYLKDELKLSARHTIVMAVTGQAMLPSYQPGDRVLVDLSQKTLVADAVYVISDGTSTPDIRRLQRVPFSNPPQVIILSDNASLQAFTVEMAKLKIIGRVCGVIARR
ncbi:LexA family transcriptional regulator [Allorhizobium sp. BGMRC 0089]|uniref:LexA family transcriptional regulator n=1 Tax=Allorhizobium sonneratiae TaxID=2934936 RepID=UPI0020332899|nr:LexA family transcriptional regulator [Allorhizobium sonneratiae]MCM2293781.1 LexA family transcriptional regulator [Allorhizobium sonneratiae]